MEHAASSLAAWESFYVIIGSSAAALTGLQFVVVALISESSAPSTIREVDAFGTPTIVYFSSVLLVSAILSAPWRAISNAGLALGACGIAGLVYVPLVIRRIRRQTGYQPVFEDWLWHAILPLVGYLGLLTSAIVLPQHLERALFGIGATALLLLFIGIHNAWDAVTYLAVARKQAKDAEDRS